MKITSPASVIFSVRAFAAAMLALYFSYQLDLSRPTWAFITVYIVSAPLRGAGRSKGLYRMLGTLCGASLAVAIIPNLVDAPELLVLALALWIGGCLYLSIVDGTPRSYALMLAGYTTALVGFPSVNAPQTIFDTAVSRTEEIGLAILCVELMGYFPFNQRASAALQAKVEKCLLDTRTLAISLMTFNPNAISITDRARLMIDVANMNALRIHAHYDTPDFSSIEGWVVRLQRHLRDFFADLITFDTQLRKAQTGDAQIIKSLSPITGPILAWIESGEIAVPPKLNRLLADVATSHSQQQLIKCGILDTLYSIVMRRSECLALRQNILTRTKTEEDYAPIAYFVDYRQAALYGLAVALQLIVGCAFWITTGWPEGSVMAIFATVVCCNLASLETPPALVSIALVVVCIGSFIGWGYNFIVFPHIDGFPLLAFALALSCIPIGIGMADPRLTAVFFLVIYGINLANFQNSFEADITGFLNSFLAQTIGIVFAGAVLGFMRAITIKDSTKRLLMENGRALALLADDASGTDNDVMDRMTHRSALALVRVPLRGLRRARW